MAEPRMIDINQKSGQAQAEFNPKSLTVAAGDQINWRNNTPDPHWPAPKGKPKDTWMDYQIPGKLAGQPAPTSQQTLTFGAAMTVDYVCALHPEETGTITVQ